MFLDEVMSDIKNHVFYFDFLLAFTVLFFWFRFLVMLMLTETFGPLLEIVMKMIVDMLIFFGIFLIQIVTFASVGILLFAEVPEYDTLPEAVLYIFQSSLGQYDLAIYKVIGGEQISGRNYISGHLFFASICFYCSIYS